MNQIMFDEAMKLIDSMSAEDWEDALSSNGIDHSAKLQTRKLTFYSEGFSGDLARQVKAILLAQLGDKWIELDRMWASKDPSGCFSGSYSSMTVVVEDEKSEAMIRLAIPTHITIKSRFFDDSQNPTEDSSDS